MRSGGTTRLSISSRSWSQTIMQMRCPMSCELLLSPRATWRSRTRTCCHERGVSVIYVTAPSSMPSSSTRPQERRRGRVDGVQETLRHRDAVDAPARTERPRHRRARPTLSRRHAIDATSHWFICPQVKGWVLRPALHAHGLGDGAQGPIFHKTEDARAAVVRGVQLRVHAGVRH